MPNVRMWMNGDKVEAEVNGEKLSFETIAEAADHFHVDGESLADKLNESGGYPTVIEVN